MLLAGVGWLCVPTAEAAAKPSVSSISRPPKALEAGGSFKLTTTVTGRARGKTVTFYLSADKKLSLADPELAGIWKVEKAPRATTSVRVPAAIPAGTYRVLACLGSVCHAGGGETKVGVPSPTPMLAFSDAQTVPTTTELVSELQDTPKPVCAPKRATPSLKTALADARTYLSKTAAAATKKLDASADTRTAGDAKEFAAGALVDGSPAAALAAYLDAYSHDPKDPELLIDMAGVLTPLEMPRDALAMLAAAQQLGASASSPAGYPMQAVALDDQGYAEMSMCDYSSAKSALNAAIALAPSMREARVNLAGVALATNGATPATATAAAQAIHRDPEVPVDQGDGGLEVPVAANVFDMSDPSPDPSLPELKLDSAESVEQAAALGASGGYWEQLYNAAESAHQPAPIPPQQQLAPATQERFQAALEQIGDNDLATKALRDQVAQDEQDVSGALQSYFGSSNGWMTVSQSNDPQSACGQTRAAHAKWLMYMQPFQADTLNLINEEYERDSAIAANFKDPYYHAALENTIDNWVASQYALMAQQAWYWGQRLDAADMWVSTGGGKWYYDGGCTTAQSAVSAGSPTPITTPPVNDCEAAFGKEAELSLDLEIFSIDLSCEEVGVEVAAPDLIGPFVSTTYNWETGAVTVFGGVKVGGSLPGTGWGGEADAGFYVSAGPSGVTDVGVKATTSESYQVGPVTRSLGGTSVSYGVADMVSVGT
jgi:hypothetical protein